MALGKSLNPSLTCTYAVVAGDHRRGIVGAQAVATDVEHEAVVGVSGTRNKGVGEGGENGVWIGGGESADGGVRAT